MQKLRESILIDAPREKVWDMMLGEATYREWTTPFSEGSYYIGSFEEGADIRFLGPDQENPESGKEMGMVSKVRESRRPEFVSVEHLGFIKDGVEDFTSDEVKKWTPAFENYTFNEKDNGTEVVVELDTPDEYHQMMKDMWPKALQKLKEICER